MHDIRGARFLVTCYQRRHMRELSLLPLNVTHSFASSLFLLLCFNESDDDGRRIAFSNIQWAPATS